jgi:hypothetical protein
MTVNKWRPPSFEEWPRNEHGHLLWIRDPVSGRLHMPPRRPAPPGFGWLDTKFPDPYERLPKFIESNEDARELAKQIEDDRAAKSDGGRHKPVPAWCDKFLARHNEYKSDNPDWTDAHIEREIRDRIAAKDDPPIKGLPVSPGLLREARRLVNRPK